MRCIMNKDEKLFVLNERLGPPSSSLDDEKIHLLYLYLDEVEEFKEVCTNMSKVDEAETQDWFSLSLGFFIAKDIVDTTFPDTDDEQTEFLDAHILSIACRYTYHYWC